MAILNLSQPEIPQEMKAHIVEWHAKGEVHFICTTDDLAEAKMWECRIKAEGHEGDVRVRSKLNGK